MSSNVIRQECADGFLNNGNTSFYARDHLGSVTDVVDSGGTLQARLDYDPYGRPSQSTSGLLNALSFGGLAHVPGTSIVMTPMRAYDADLGRWLSEDPSGMVDGPNLYQYVGGSPVNYTDPMGLQQALPAPGGTAPTGGAIANPTCRVIPFPEPAPPPTPNPGFAVFLGAFFMVLANPTNAGEGSDMPGGGCAEKPPNLGPQRCRPFRQSKKGCTCFVACNIDPHGKNPPKIYPERVNGIGTGSDCAEAKKNAEANARANFDAFTGGKETGLKTKHCHDPWCKDH